MLCIMLMMNKDQYACSQGSLNTKMFINALVNNKNTHVMAIYPG